VMGHLNTQHYTALFDHAMWELMRQLGVHDSHGRDALLGWADVETTVRYLREVSVGSAVRIRSRLLRVGRTSLVTEHVLLLAESGEERTTCRTTSVRFDLSTRRAVEVPEALRRFRHSPEAGDL